MSAHYVVKARRHWTKWLPRRTAELKAQGEFETSVQVAGRQARERVDELMARGYQLHEAEEVAFAEFILLRPEPGVEG